MEQEQVSRWHLYILRVLRITGILASLIVLIFLIARGYGIEWTGFGESRIQKANTTEDIRRYKTLWDWLQLLIIPVALALVGFWFNQRQNKRAERIEDERARDGALQAYLDQMSELLIIKGLRSESREHGDSRVTARARTLTVLSQLDGDRKRRVLQFLREARLINKDHDVLEGHPIYSSIVGLKDADLTNADLSGLKLADASLNGADLRGANLRGANLQDVKGMDQKQIEEATGDKTTRLPKYIDRPNSWTQRLEERRQESK